MAELTLQAVGHYIQMVDDSHGVSVESTNIKKVGHDGSEVGWLVVRFQNESIYAYYPVSYKGFHAILQAQSSGKWFNENIKSNKGISCFKLRDKQ